MSMDQGGYLFCLIEAGHIIAEQGGLVIIDQLMNSLIDLIVIVSA